MALAIAVHNIPEVGNAPLHDFSSNNFHGKVSARLIGTLDDVSRLWQGVIVAAPVFAATGSRWKAMGVAVASVRAP